MPLAEQLIVKVVALKYSFICEVECGSGDVFLTVIPPVIGDNVTITFGDYLLVDYFANAPKIKAKVFSVLTQAHINFYAKEGVWPERFADALEHVNYVVPFRRIRRFMMVYSDDSSSSDEEDTSDAENDSGIE